MNYQQLFQTVKGYVANDFPNTNFGNPTATPTNFTSKEQVDTFIRQAEERIYNSVQFPSLRKNVTGIATPNNKYLSAPGDFLSVYSMAAILANGDYEYLLNKDVNFIRAAYPNPMDTGAPRFFN